MEALNSEKENELTSEGEIAVDIASEGRKARTQNVDCGKEVLDVSSESTSEKISEETPEEDIGFSPDSGTKAQPVQDHHEAESKLDKPEEDIQFEALTDGSSNSDDGTYECYMCSGDFDSFSVLQMHLVDLHDVEVKSQLVKEFCIKCGKKVILPAPKDGPITCNGCKYTCDKCHFIFKSKGSFTKHSMKNPYGELYNCGLCSEGFLTRCELRIHGETHRAQQTPELFECNVCGKGFREKKRLKDHKDTNCGQDPFKCKKCGKNYFTRVHLHSHEKSHADPSRNMCPTCGRSFKCCHDLKWHMEDHAKNDLIVCVVCDKTFSSKSDFKVHFETHKAHHNQDFVCKVCSKTFLSKQALKAHVGRIHLRTSTQVSDQSENTSPRKQRGKTCETKSGLKEHEKTRIDSESSNVPSSHIESHDCEVCGKSFRYLTSLRKHIRLHSQAKSQCEVCGSGTCNGCKYTCDKCQLIFKSKGSFTKHSMKNPYGELYNCGLCSEAFLSKCELTIHGQTHKGKTREIFECNICGKGFHEKRRLKDHKDTNCGQDPFKCKKCGMGYFTRTQLHSHEKSHEDPSQNVCPTCGQSFKYRHNLKGHMKVHTKEDLTVCVVCDKTFSNRSNFKVHLETHKANRRRDFVCEVCSRTFLSKQALKSHVGKNHLKKGTKASGASKNNLMCKQCGKMCETVNDLRKHEKTHIDNGPHDCELCGKSFRYLTSLRQHMRVHSQTVKFQCDVCNYSCATKHHLTVHKVTHLEKPYECGVCGVPFVDASSLRKHVRSHEDDGTIQDINPACLSSKQKGSPLEVDVNKDKIREGPATASVAVVELP